MSILLSEFEKQINRTDQGQDKSKDKESISGGRAGIDFRCVLGRGGFRGASGHGAAAHQKQAQKDGKDAFHGITSRKGWLHYK